jgi:hypothetical protein
MRYDIQGSFTRELVQRIGAPRPRVRDAEAAASDYTTTFRLALESPAARSVLKMILEVIYYSNAKMGDIEYLLAKALSGSQSNHEIVNSVIPVISRLGDDSQLYTAVVKIFDLNIEKLNSPQYPSIMGDLLAYSTRNLPTLKSDENLRTTVAGILLSLLGESSGIDREMLSSYLISGNLFSHGVKIPLTSERNKEQIALIQRTDKNFTPVDIDDRLKIDLGEGEVIKIQKLLVDGSDPTDQRLGVQIIIEVEGQPHTLSFNGSERLLLQSQKPNHVVEVGRRSLRFGIEIKSQQLTLMAVPL